MNCIKRLLVEREIKRGVKAFEGVRVLVGVLSLPTLDLLAKRQPVSLSCSMKSARRLT